MFVDELNDTQRVDELGGFLLVVLADDFVHYRPSSVAIVLRGDPF